MTGMIKQR